MRAIYLILFAILLISPVFSQDFSSSEKVNSDKLSISEYSGEGVKISIHSNNTVLDSFELIGTNIQNIERVDYSQQNRLANGATIWNKTEFLSINSSFNNRDIIFNINEDWFSKRDSRIHDVNIYNYIDGEWRELDLNTAASGQSTRIYARPENFKLISVAIERDNNLSVEKSIENTRKSALKSIEETSLDIEENSTYYKTVENAKEAYRRGDYEKALELARGVKKSRSSVEERMPSYLYYIAAGSLLAIVILYKAIGKFRKWSTEKRLQNIIEEIRSLEDRSKIDSGDLNIEELEELLKNQKYSKANKRLDQIQKRIDRIKNSA